MIKKIKKEIHEKLNSKAFMNFFWNSSGQVVNVFFLLLLNIFLARFLEPINYGRVQVAQGLLFFIFCIDQIVFAPLSRKLYIQNPNKNKSILAAYSDILTKAYLSILALFLLFWFFFKNQITDPLPFQIVLCQLVFMPFNRYLALVELFNSKLMSKKVMSLLNIANFLSCMFVFLCVYFGLPLYFLGFAFGLKSYLMWLFVRKFFDQSDIGLFIQDDFLFYKKKLLYESLPFFFNEILKKIIERSDRLILGFFHGPAVVAFYVAGIKLCEPWSMFVNSVSISKHPSLVKSSEISRESLFKNYIRYLKAINIFSLFLIFIGVFFSKKIIFFVYGPQYDSSSFILKINLWILPFLFWWSTEANIAVILGLGRKIFYKNTIAAFINLGINFLLVPKMGLNGSLYANVVTYVFLGCLGNLLFKETWVLFKLQMKSLWFFDGLSKKPQVIDK